MRALPDVDVEALPRVRRRPDADCPSKPTRACRPREPPPVAKRLRGELEKALANPDIAKRFGDQDLEALTGAPEEFMRLTDLVPRIRHRSKLE